MARYEFGGITELAKAGVRRRGDAGVLKEKGRWRGAMYLLGYSIECRLKAKLMEKLSARSLAELDEKVLTRFGRTLKGRDRSIAFLAELLEGQQRGPEIRVAFNVCARWSTSWRYDPREASEKECSEFFASADTFLRFIETSLY